MKSDCLKFYFIEILLPLKKFYLLVLKLWLEQV